MDLAFRAATPADAPAIVTLVQSAYRGESSRAGWTTEADLLDGQRTDQAAVDDLIADPGSVILLATDADGALVGCCHLQHRGSHAYFGMFAVDPLRQAGGVGKEILAEAERMAAEGWGAGQMQMTVITVREELIAWYVRRGYTRTGKTSPFPHSDERFGLPRRADLEFELLVKALAA